MSREHKLRDTCIDISAPGEMPGFAWICGPDCREEAPSAPKGTPQTVDPGAVVVLSTLAELRAAKTRTGGGA